MELSRAEEEFIKSVYQNISFYANKAAEAGIDIGTIDLRESWTMLPIVKKSEILEISEEMLMPDCIPLWLSNHLHSVTTSGSSGMYLKIYWKLIDTVKSLIPLWIYRKKEYDISPDDRYCYFYTTRSFGEGDKTEERLRKQMGFSKNNLSNKRLIEIYNEMYKFEPAWLLLQPSMAIMLNDVKKKNNLPDLKKLKYIELSGEMSTKNLKKELENTFHCKVANQYGSYEVNSIAYECPEGNLHCMVNNVITEILDVNGCPVENGVEGDIYVTSLHNKAMPFIRYEIGDRGYFDVHKCSCGRTGKILHLTWGRNTEWIYTVLGDKINPYVLVRPIENINRILDNVIVQFQIIQNEYDEFTYRLVAEEEFYDVIREMIPDNICEKKLARSRFNVQFCENILPDSDTGKWRWFVGIE